MITESLLVETERIYSSGEVTLGITPWRKSPFDRETPPTSVFDGHRMRPRTKDHGRARGYAKAYSEVLKDREINVMAEMGILRGIGLAIWCDVFPKARIIGLDWDLTAYADFTTMLLKRGAFQKNTPEIHQFDEISPFASYDLRRILGREKLDLFIDDALHYDAAIINSFSAFHRSVKIGGLYIIEDNKNVASVLAKTYRGQHEVRSFNELTVITIGEG